MQVSSFTENQFVQSFVEQVRPDYLLGTEGNYFQQIGTLNGIPDILTIKNSGWKELKNFLKEYPSLNLLNGHARLITHLSNRVFHKKDFLLSKTGLSDAHFKKSIYGLINMNIVEEKDNKAFRLVEHFILPKIDLWSFEFKLHDWQSALTQSMRYRTFSSYACVVMPTNKKEILKSNSRLFRKFNIGALIYDPVEVRYEFVTKPQRCGALSKERYIDALGRLFAHN